MGTEKDKIRSVNRNRPPPIPPRPQHLIPVKAISKYSSMPDILNGWKKDTNPDLLKVNDGGGGGHKKSVFSISRGEYRLKNGHNTMVANGVKNGAYNGNGVVNYDNAVIPDKAASNGKTSRKFSCIPSRSNSKKKKNILSSINVCNNNTNGSSNNSRNGKSNNRAEISQTSWYVEDVGNTMVQLSKCEITLNSDNTNHCRYNEQISSPVTVVSTGSANCLTNKERYRRFRSPMTSSSSLSGLPPLPKSLSDASLLWESADKKLSSYSINLSSSSSNASSCSRSSGGGVHAKVPLSSPKSASSGVTQDEVVTTQSSDGTTVPRDEQKPTQPPPPPPRKPTSLDMKLAILRKEMHDLRQMDLSLLSQLWSLNEAIHEFRQMQESFSPHTPSSHSSDEDDFEGYYSNVNPQGMVTSSQHNTLGSNSSRSSVGTSRNNIRET